MFFRRARTRRHTAHSLPRKRGVTRGTAATIWTTWTVAPLLFLTPLLSTACSAREKPHKDSNGGYEAPEVYRGKEERSG